MTLREFAKVLNPPMTMAQITALTIIAAIPPAGIRRTGRAGRPAITYETAAVLRAHGEEARRTAKRFTDSDWIASALLGRNLIRADTGTGEIWWADGIRAEEIRPGFYGAVRVGQCRSPAHRIIWIAADGEIPPALQVNHVNKLTWDNRRANLELVTHEQNLRHRDGEPYLTYHEAVRQLAELPAPELPDPVSDQCLVRAGGAFRAVRNWPATASPR
jgi:hypothetical protein